MPVPYNIGFELSIFCKLNDDALQIVEQILPYFQPAFNITVDLVEALEKRKIFQLFLTQYRSKMTMREISLQGEH